MVRQQQFPFVSHSRCSHCSIARGGWREGGAGLSNRGFREFEAAISFCKRRRNEKAELCAFLHVKQTVTVDVSLSARRFLGRDATIFMNQQMAKGMLRIFKVCGDDASVPYETHPWLS